MDNKLLHQIRTLIIHQTGLRIPDDNTEGLRRLILNRIKAFKLASATDYYLFLLRSNRTELAHEHEKLTAGLTTGETFFFRDQGQFDLLSQYILPQLIERNRDKRRLRIWSAGCSSGEEPYSLAMLLDEQKENLSNWQILILGTDINPDALAKARQGHYDPWSFRQVSEQRKQRFFESMASKWVLKPHIRQRVDFRRINLVTEDFPKIGNDICQLDLILCRNVFIYLESKTVSQIAEKMTDTLVEGGYLMTGHGELYAHHLGGLRTHVSPNSIVYQKAGYRHFPTSGPPSAESLQKPARLLPDLPDKARIVPSKSDVTQPGAVKAQASEPIAVAETMQDAWTYANQGQPEKARACCDKLVAHNPLDYQPYYLFALLAQEQGEQEQTKALLKKVLYLAPDFISAYLELGDIYAKESNLALAKKMWSTAAQLLRQLPPNANISMFGNSTAIDILRFVENRLNEKIAFY